MRAVSTSSGSSTTFWISARWKRGGSRSSPSRSPCPRRWRTSWSLPARSPKRGQTITGAIGSDLPALRADPVRFKQILLGTPKGSGQRRILRHIGTLAMAHARLGRPVAVSSRRHGGFWPWARLIDPGAAYSGGPAFIGTIIGTVGGVNGGKSR